MKIWLWCSMVFSTSCRTQKTMSTQPLPALKPHWELATESSTTDWSQSLSTLSLSHTQYTTLHDTTLHYTLACLLFCCHWTDVCTARPPLLLNQVTHILHRHYTHTHTHTLYAQKQKSKSSCHQGGHTNPAELDWLCIRQALGAMVEVPLGEGPIPCKRAVPSSWITYGVAVSRG